MTAADPSPSGHALALARRGEVAGAMELLSEAIAAGDAMAAATLADWRVGGDLVRRDLAEARVLYGKAADLGLGEAEPVYIALLANGAGGSGRRWAEALARLGRRAGSDPLAAHQRDLIAAMAIDAQGDPLEPSPREVISEEPRIAVIRGFLSAAECRYLAEQALPALQPAIVVHPQTGRAMLDPVRTALSAGFPFVLEDPVIHAINRRIMAATGTSYEQGEPIQVLSYEPGQEYKLHSDCLPPPPPGQRLNQRIQTFLVTLDDRFEGGETSFPRIGLNLRCAAGDAVHFVNIDQVGQPEQLAWHAGLPVKRGRKLLLSKWIRQAPLDLSGPPGRPF